MNVDQCKRELLKLWENINTIIGMIHSGRYNKAQVELLDARLKEMTDKYSTCDINSGSVHIPDWMMVEGVFKLEIVERFKYTPGA